MGTFMRRPLLPMMIWAMTTALAYAAGKRRRDGSRARGVKLRRRASARAARSGRKA
jgi:hypothetical protein